MQMLFLLAVVAQAQPRVAVVVVDEGARQEGYTLQLDDWVADDALPVDVAEGETVVLVSPDGSLDPLDVLPGEVWEITGQDGEAWMSLLDEEVRADVIRVRGPVSAIRALARSLDAEIVVDEGKVWLSGPDILLTAPWVDDPLAREVRAVELVRVQDEDAATQVTSPAAEAPRRRVAAPVQAVTAVRPAPVVEAASVPNAEGAAIASEPEVRARPESRARAESRPRSEARGRKAHRQAPPLAPYVGMHLCRDQVLYLHPAGVYALGTAQGSWTVVAPGVVRLLSPSGELWYRAAINPNTGWCSAVW